MTQRFSQAVRLGPPASRGLLPPGPPLLPTHACPGPRARPLRGRRPRRTPRRRPSSIRRPRRAHLTLPPTPPSTVACHGAHRPPPPHPPARLPGDAGRPPQQGKPRARQQPAARLLAAGGRHLPLVRPAGRRPSSRFAGTVPAERPGALGATSPLWRNEGGRPLGWVPGSVRGGRRWCLRTPASRFGTREDVTCLSHFMASLLQSDSQVEESGTRKNVFL